MNAASIDRDRELLYRFAEVEKPDQDAMERGRGKRSLRVAFSSETPVVRNENGQRYYEVLDHSPENADLSLLQDGGAFIDEHNWERQIGSIDSAWLDSDRKGRADLSFADTELGRERWKLMSKGHRKDISFGYVQTRKLGETRGADGIPVRRFAWQAFEITSTAVGADHFGTGVGRSKSKIEFMETEERNDIESSNELTARAEMFIKDYPHLASEIRMAKHEALNNGESFATFGRAMLALVKKTPAPRQTVKTVLPDEIGMDRRDIEQYSIHRAIRSMATGNGKMEPCYELDVSRQVEKNFKTETQGLFIPLDVCLGTSKRNYMQRDMTVGDFNSGGAAVGTAIMPFIDLLRNRTVVTRLGAAVLSGLSSDVAFPREVAPATAQSVSEVGLLADSNPELDQIRMSPNRVGVTVTYGRQLVFQSTPDIESLIRNDMMATVSIYHDEMFLNGSGAADQPTGLMQWIGLNSVAFGGPATFGKICDMETSVGKMNADMGNLAYVTTPATKGKLKQTAVALTGATTVSSRSIWENGSFNDGSNDGVMNSYRSASTNQIPGDRVLFGNWNDFIVAYWSGFEMIYDPFTSAKKAQIVTTLNTWIDCAPRHPQSFTLSADSGAQ